MFNLSASSSSPLSGLHFSSGLHDRNGQLSEDGDTIVHANGLISVLRKRVLRKPILRVEWLLTAHLRMRVVASLSSTKLSGVSELRASAAVVLSHRGRGTSGRLVASAIPASVVLTPAIAVNCGASGVDVTRRGGAVIAIALSISDRAKRSQRRPSPTVVDGSLLTHAVLIDAVGLHCNLL